MIPGHQSKWHSARLEELPPALAASACTIQQRRQLTTGRPAVRSIQLRSGSSSRLSLRAPAKSPPRKAAGSLAAVRRMGSSICAASCCCCCLAEHAACALLCSRRGFAAGRARAAALLVCDAGAVHLRCRTAGCIVAGAAWRSASCVVCAGVCLCEGVCGCVCEGLCRNEIGEESYNKRTLH